MNDKKRLDYILKEYSSDIDIDAIKSMCVCFCRYCGEYALVLPKPLESYPIRKRDMSRVIKEEDNDFKFKLQYGGDTYIRRDVGLERQCRLYCMHCRLLVAYRLSPPQEKSTFFYLIKNSITIDPDIMINEVKNYRLRIPSFIRRDPDNPTSSTLLLFHADFDKDANQIVGYSNKGLLVEMKYAYQDEGESNKRLIQFFGTVFRISPMNLSFSLETDGLALRVDAMDYEMIYLRLKDYVEF